MNRLKRCTLIGILFVSVTGTLSHFLYQFSGNCFLTGLFSPVGESTWEHMKLLFFPMLFYSLWMSACLRKEEPGVVSALALGNLAGCALIPIIFLHVFRSFGVSSSVAGYSDVSDKRAGRLLSGLPPDSRQQSR